MKEYFVWLLKVFTLIFIFMIMPILVVSTLVVWGNSVARNPVIELNTNGKNVAVVEMLGEISDTKEIVAELYKQANNDQVQGIVLRIDSPGGAVAPSQDVYNTVKKLKKLKPIVVSMGSMAASGGLYSALSASKIVCQPGTLTGSIGVIMQLPNVKNIAEKVGFQMITITSGQYKDIGNVFRDMTEEEKEFLHNIIGDIRESFVNAVVEGRNLKREDVEKFADGRVLTGTQALHLGLVDKFGDIYDAAREVYELKGKPLKAGEYPNLKYSEDNMKKLRKFFESFIELPVKLLGQDKPQLEVMYR